MAGRAAGGAVIGSDGRGVIRVGPGPAWEVWDVVGYSIQLADATAGEIRVYEGPETDTNLVDSSYDGVLNTSDRMPGTLKLTANEYLTFVWSNATVGAVALAVVRYL